MKYTGTEPVKLYICEPALEAQPGEEVDVAEGLVEIVKPHGFEEVAPKAKK
jgi:predicted peroxiredoxin